MLENLLSLPANEQAGLFLALVATCFLIAGIIKFRQIPKAKRYYGKADDLNREGILLVSIAIFIAGAAFVAYFKLFP